MSKANLFAFLLLGFTFLNFHSLIAQTQSKFDIALTHIQEYAKEWDLNPNDIQDIYLNKSFTSAHNQVTHLYLSQRYQGIEIYNAINSIHIDADDNVAFAKNRFIGDLDEKVKSLSTKINANKALALVQIDLGLSNQIQIIGSESPGEWKFDKGEAYLEHIYVNLYLKSFGEELKPAYAVLIHPTVIDDQFLYWIDANSGQLLQKQSVMHKCSFKNEPAHQHDKHCTSKTETPEEHHGETLSQLQPIELPLNPEPTYNVFELPIESPAHGERTLVTDPSCPVASPYGWHDVDLSGVKITRLEGNNAHAYSDRDNNNYPDSETEGGMALNFSFPLPLDQEPIDYQDASATNLFYMVNVMHDFSYHYGFDEAAGNFQLVNETAGEGGDYVNAQSQFGANGSNADFFNTASFNISSDGAVGRLRTNLWKRSTDELLNISAPENASERILVNRANFGNPIGNVAIEGQVAWVSDDSSQPSLGCNALTNGNELLGKIALIDRGTCDFSSKVKHAQDQGAIAVIICNYEDELIVGGMGSGIDASLVVIPSVLVKKSDCTKLNIYLNQGLEVSLYEPVLTGTERLDASLDNFIISHEYAHGISNRLVGGANRSGCLNFEEINGDRDGETTNEGWSDFFGLVMTHPFDKDGTLNRGVAPYLTRQSIDSSGLRDFPYNIDMSVNPLTYDDIVLQSVPHGVGAVWASILWDMYWALVDKHGFDEDLYTGSKGNNICIQLVMDALKMIPCEAGFVDGREAILAADRINNDGENQKLIWQVFARRGVGFSATQGSPLSRGDNHEAFDVMPEFSGEVLVDKKVTPLIDAGDEIIVTLKISNFSNADISDLMVEDIIGENANYKEGSCSYDFTLINDKITFDIGTLEQDSILELEYTMNTVPNFGSRRYFYDDVESGDQNWEIDYLRNFNIWERRNTQANSGSFAWYVPDEGNSSEQLLLLRDPLLIEGVNPVLRFYHKTDMESGFDAGLVEVSTNNLDWIDLSDLFIRNPYDGPVSASTFRTEGLNGFWGFNDAFRASYIDLKDFIGQSIYVRFRFGSDQQSTGRANGLGWFVDDVELMDMKNFNSEVCLYYNGNVSKCTAAQEKGSIVNPLVNTTSTEDQNLNLHHFNFYPNPTSDLLNITWDLEAINPIQIQLISLEGKVIKELVIAHPAKDGAFKLPLEGISAGFYFVEMLTADTKYVHKIFIRK